MKWHVNNKDQEEIIKKSSEKHERIIEAEEWNQYTQKKTTKKIDLQETHKQAIEQQSTTETEAKGIKSK